VTPHQSSRSIVRLNLAVFGLLVVTVVGITFSIAVSSIAMGLAIAIWVAQLVLSRGASFPRTPLDYAFLAYAIAELISTIFSVDAASSFLNMKRLVLMGVVYITLTSVNSRRRLVWSLILFLGVASLLSLAESVFVLLPEAHMARLSVFQHYMTAGGMKMFVALFLLSFIVGTGSPPQWRIASLCALIPTGAALLLTQTRGSWLGFLAGGITLGIVKDKRLLLGLPVLVVLFVLIAPADFQSRGASIFDPSMTSNLSRINMITTGWRMFLDYPLVGTGDIDLRRLYITYTEPIDTAEGGHLHNNFMMLLVTLGAIGFTVVMAMFVKIFITEWQAFRNTRDDWLMGRVAAGSFAAYVAFHVNGLFEWNFGDHEIALLLWFTVGLTLSAQRLVKQDERANA
jgi:O-antigen ligase